MPQDFVKIARRGELMPGKMKLVDLDGRHILLANVDGSYYAADDTSIHEDASLLTDFAIEQSLCAAPLPPGLAGKSEEGDDVAVAFNSAAFAGAAGRAALAAKPGPVRDRLVSAAALCLWHIKRYNGLRSAAVRAVLDNGTARARCTRGT